MGKPPRALVRPPLQVADRWHGERERGVPQRCAQVDLARPSRRLFLKTVEILQVELT
jgi:hypothetical protein